MKFVLYIDYKTIGKFEYRPLNAKTLEEAIEEADKIHNPNEHFLIRIMKKEGKIEKDGNLKKAMYKAILCKRTHGWHINNQENCENEHLVNRWYANGFENYEAI